MKLTYFGHSAFLVHTGGKNLLFDPFISPNELAKDIDINSIPADYILLSHGHGDHIADTLAIEKRTGATIISNYEIVTWMQNNGAEKAHPLNHGGKFRFDFGSAKYTNAVHSSSFPDGTYAGNPGGFIVENKEGAFYYSGDTALMYDMKLFGEMHKLSFAVLPIGDNFTMGYEDAAIAAMWLKVPTVIGVHYDTFGYIKIDHHEAEETFREMGIKLLLPKIGETIEV